MGREPSWYRYDAAGRRLTLSIYVQPNARKTEIMGVHGGALKLRIAAPAVDNKANAELMEFLREMLDVPKSAISLRLGSTGRRKVLEVVCDDARARRLEKWL